MDFCPGGGVLSISPMVTCATKKNEGKQGYESKGMKFQKKRGNGNAFVVNLGLFPQFCIINTRKKGLLTGIWSPAIRVGGQVPWSHMTAHFWSSIPHPRAFRRLTEAYLHKEKTKSTFWVSFYGKHFAH